MGIKRACELLKVSRSGYYTWLKRPVVSKQDILDEHLYEAFKKSKNTYGTRRLKAALKRKGIKASRQTIGKRMKIHGLIARGAKKYKATTNSNHRLATAPNLLMQDFHASEKNQVWVSDFTYIHTKGGYLYLAVIIDLYSRRVVGWYIHNRMTKELVIEALKMALRQRKPKPGLIIHSDRGSQYCSHDYQNILQEYGLICSMSKKGDPYDNACAETFFHSMKVECIHEATFDTHCICYDVIAEYIEVFFNRQRLHSYLGYQSPCEFETAS